MDAPFPEEDFRFALENTRVLREPLRRIDTFGNTLFEFQILSEPMDAAVPVTIRSGRIEAQKPKIITSDQFKDFSLEGFGEQADEFRSFLQGQQEWLKLIQYGWHLRRSEFESIQIHEPLAAVEERVLAEANEKDNPLLAILTGIEDIWEASLVRFTIDLVTQSTETNLFDLKRRGML